MNGELLIINGRVVTPRGVIKGARIKISKGIITDISPPALKEPELGKVEAIAPGDNLFCPSIKIKEEANGGVIDAGDNWVLPGCVDLHSDALEREIEPRPRAIFPVEVAFRELEKRLAGCGVTTIFHSLSFAEEQLGLRSNELAARVIRRLVQLAAGPALIRHRIHLRYEITDLSAIPLILELLSEGVVDLLSFMDHTPGQGQFRQLGKYKEWVSWSYGIAEEELAKHLSLKNVDREVVLAGVRRLAEEARKMSIPMAAHDDDSPARVEFAQKLGITLSEFPVNLKTAHYARQLGMNVCVGAPNVIRGVSQAQNMRATEAIKAGAANILCSDYYPAAMLGAVFQLAKRSGSLSRTVSLVATNPAAAAGISGEVGAIEAGRRADLVLVRLEEEFPVVLATLVDGKLVYSLHYRKIRED
jgi:alpha-D-ribose 1-methylphosphonate 5-triphosphate diphosphatase